MYLGRRLKINIALNPLKKRQNVTFPPDRGVPNNTYEFNASPETKVAF